MSSLAADSALLPGIPSTAAEPLSIAGATLDRTALRRVLGPHASELLLDSYSATSGHRSHWAINAYLRAQLVRAPHDWDFLPRRGWRPFGESGIEGAASSAAAAGSATATAATDTGVVGSVPPAGCTPPPPGILGPGAAQVPDEITTSLVLTFLDVPSLVAFGCTGDAQHESAFRSAAADRIWTQLSSRFDLFIHPPRSGDTAPEVPNQGAEKNEEGALQRFLKDPALPAAALAQGANKDEAAVTKDEAVRVAVECAKNNGGSVIAKGGEGGGGRGGGGGGGGGAAGSDTGMPVDCAAAAGGGAEKRGGVEHRHAYVCASLAALRTALEHEARRHCLCCDPGKRVQGAVRPICYGFPSDVLIRGIRAGTFSMGGDYLFPSAPNWECRECGRSFQAYPWGREFNDMDVLNAGQGVRG